ncbi:MAG: DUF4397 domain-containing protein [Chitinivibrionales bacterium]|nr:DUF4397 domain-containing protein [Chitinivibrionales bacterium]
MLPVAAVFVLACTLISNRFQLQASGRCKKENLTLHTHWRFIMKHFARFAIVALAGAAMLQAAVDPQTARLQVIHNAADPGAALVDIYLDGQLLLNDFGFRQASPYIDAPAETDISVAVAPASSQTVADSIATFDLRLDSGHTYVAVANGVLDPTSFAANPDGKSIAFTIWPKAMAREAASHNDKVEFMVVHGATDAPAVDVHARGGAKLVTGAAYGDMTGYLEVPPAKYILDITPKDDANTLVAAFEADLSGLAGSAAVVFASGFLAPSSNSDGEAFGIFAALPSGDVVEFPALQTARLQVIHNAADPGAASVDIYLDGAMLIDDFAFRAASAYIDAPAGKQITVGVAPDNSSSSADIIADFNLTLTPGETYVAVANGVLDPAGFVANPDGKATAFNIFVKSMTREAAVESDKVEFIVMHGATDAPAVDVIARGVGKLVDKAAYGDITDYLAVPPAAYVLDITPEGDPNTTVATFTADLSSLGGGAAVVFASGFLAPADNQDGEGFGLYVALPDGSVLELPAGSTPVGFTRSNLVTKAGLWVPGTLNLSSGRRAKLTYSIVNPAQVSLALYNMNGRQVAILDRGYRTAGSYAAQLTDSKLLSGQYIVKLQSGSYGESRALRIIK